MVVVFIASQHGSGCPYHKYTEDEPWMETGLVHLGLNGGGLQDSECLTCPGILVVELGLIPECTCALTCTSAKDTGVWALSILIAECTLGLPWICAFILPPRPEIPATLRPSPGLFTLTL